MLLAPSFERNREPFGCGRSELQAGEKPWNRLWVDFPRWFVGVGGFFSPCYSHLYSGRQQGGEAE